MPELEISLRVNETEKAQIGIMKFDRDKDLKMQIKKFCYDHAVDINKEVIFFKAVENENNNEQSL